VWDVRPITVAWFVTLVFMDQSVREIVQLVVARTLAIYEPETVHAFLILLGKDVINANPVSTENITINNAP
jgi:hypothetical protein